MYHLATELTHPRQRPVKTVYLEVRQGMRVAGSVAPLVHAERRGAACRLPARALLARSVDEFDTQDPAPEAPCAIRIVGRELDEMYR